VSLVEKQVLFAKLLGRLLSYATEQGIFCTMGECYRSPAVAQLNALKGIGIANSLHTQRLAVDLQLFRPDGPDAWTYLAAGTEPEYAKLGDFWCSLTDLCRWGGHFRPKPDYDHYSLTHNGAQ